MTNTTIENISAYKFTNIIDLEAKKEFFSTLCEQEGIKGTILLTPEGINIMLAGTHEAISVFKLQCQAFADIGPIGFKTSYSELIPYKKLKVKIKKAIIPMDVEGINPKEYTSKNLSPETLKSWLDDGRDFTFLDTRNDYEIQYGTFEKAIDLDIKHFRDFPEAAEEFIPEKDRQKPLVMFCTGGVRCEKAGPALEKAGFTDVYQLDGGIISYLEKCGGAHYVGDCYVFDNRISVNTALEETEFGQCKFCQVIIMPEACQNSAYQEERLCEECIH